MLCSPSCCLLVVGTYSEKLAHVDGKGEGLYVLLLDLTSMRLLSPPADAPNPLPLLGVAQLGGEGGVVNPTYITSYREPADASLRIYIADERCSDEGGLVWAANLNEATAELVVLGKPVLAGGSATCHIAVATGGRHVLVANYVDGTVAAVERRKDGSLGARSALITLPSTSPTRGLEQLITFPRANARRQECAHAHMVKMWTRGSVPSVLVADLGSDCVWTLAYEAEAQTPLRVISGCPTPQSLTGGGPRHIAVHPDPAIAVAYVAFELTSQVAAFSIDESGALGEPLPPGPICTLAVSDVSTMPKPFAADSDTSDAIKSFTSLVQEGAGGAAVCSDTQTSAAAIRVSPAADYIFVSNRVAGGEGVISSLKLLPNGCIVPPSEGGLGLTRTLGKVPRDFILLPSVNSTEHRYFALVANQDSDNIVVLSSTAPATDLNARVPTPVSLCVVPELVLDA